MSREIMQQALEALRLVGKYTDSLTCYASTISEHEANIVDPSVQLAIAALEAELAKPDVMVDIVPPATQRDRWMFEQGRLVERDPRTHAQPDHPLDKKADNARELGLDYEPERMSNQVWMKKDEIAKMYDSQPEPDHGFDRTASHMTGEYVDTAQSEPIVIMGHYVGEGKVVSASFGLPEGSFDMSTNQQNVNTSEERVQKSEECVHEPVAKVVAEISGVRSEIYPALPMGTKLYTAPPKREWKGLTDEDIDWVFGLAYADDMELLKTIEAKLREKNT